MIICVLKNYREAAGVSQAQLAEDAGVTQSQISRWETGAELPQIETLIKLGGALRVDWHLLVEQKQV